MVLPRLKDRMKTRRQVIRFGGIDYGRDAVEGELADSAELSSRGWPCLTVRKGRGGVQTLSKPNGLFAWGKLCAVDGTSLIYDGRTVGTVIDGPKEFAVVNTKLCIFPDRKYLDLDTKEFKSLDASMASGAGTVASFTANTLTLQPDELVNTLESLYSSFFYNDGGKTQRGEYRIKTYSAVSWDDTAKAWTLTGETEQPLHNNGEALVGKYVMLQETDLAGAYVLNTQRLSKGSNDRDLIVAEDYTANNGQGYYAKILHWKQNSDNSGGGIIFWNNTLTIEVRNGANVNDAFTNHFAPGDRVDVSGCTAQVGNNVEKAALKAVTASTLTFTGEIFTAGTENGVITVTRSVPSLTYICESDNRLWGCEGHTIYASALGDPKNFYVYDGLSTDSYTVAVGTDGDFTGCIAYSGNVLFWKEDKLHKVLGSYPAEYQVYDYDVPGLKRDCRRSLAIINEALYYMGLDGVYAYTGGTPAQISGKLGEKRFAQARAGADGRWYYLSGQDTDGDWHLMTYDTRYGLWLREGAYRIQDFAALGGRLYMLDGDSGTILENGTGGEALEWYAQFTPFTEDTPGKKLYGRLFLRLELGPGSWAAAEVRYDGGPWRRVWVSGDARKRVFTIPLRLRRCDRFELRLVGKGDCVVESMTREVIIGSA